MYRILEKTKKYNKVYIIPFDLIFSKSIGKHYYLKIYSK
jgi:hypothetical protein